MTATRKSAAQRPVHPAASALLILLVFGAVQFVWWRFLVYRAPAAGAGRMTGGGGPGTPDVHILGRADVFVRTFAGDEQPGTADGAPYAARFDRPTGLALDPGGSLYVADTGNNRIRLISPAGDTTTFAGGEPGFADGPVAQAKFSAPCGLCLGLDGTLYVADTGNHCIRKIKDGQVSTVGTAPPPGGASSPGTLNLPVVVALAPGAAPSLVVADAGASAVTRLSLDGKVVTQRKFASAPVSISIAPEGTATPSSGSIIAGDKILKNIPFDQTDEVTADQAARLTVKHPIAIFPWGSNWLAEDDDHGALLLIVNGKVRVLAGFCSTSGPIRGFRDGNGQFALFGKLSGVVSDGKRVVYVSDAGNNSIRRIDISELNSN